jgi:N-acetylmuramoyl-L-alanine amidase
MRRAGFVKILFFSVFALVASGCTTRSSYLRLDPALQSDVRSFGGFQYLPLTRVCDLYGLKYKWDPIVRTATITERSGTVVLRDGSDRILVNGSMRRIERPAVLSGGTLYVPVSFARTCIAPMAQGPAAVAPVEAPPVQQRPKKFSINTIVLDTGHGGRDVGALGKRLQIQEKEVALSLSRKIKSILESRGIRVIMTRADDTFIPLEKRVDIANKSCADIFVSVHFNASRSKSLRGFECYYLSNATDDNARALEAFEDSSLKLSDGADAMRSSRLDKTLWDMTLTENRMESGELANYICKSVESSFIIKNRGVRTARFYVLKHTHIPAVLVEAGYLSNPSEEEMITRTRFIDTMAQSIASGILRYKDRYEETEGFTDV